MNNMSSETIIRLQEELVRKNSQIAELEKDAFVKSNEANDATHRAIEMLLEKDERIAELEQENLELTEAIEHSGIDVDELIEALKEDAL
jgi:hypothetical protein